MTTAEKLVKIAENVQKVYKAGQQSMLDESKIIEKTVSGSVIAVDDVSEVPHEVSVQLSSDTVTDFSDVEVCVFKNNEIDSSKVGSQSQTKNPLTIINDTTYTIAPDLSEGKSLGIYFKDLNFQIGDVINCVVKSISKIGDSWGWRVSYEDGTIGAFSKSLSVKIVVDKPIKYLNLYCDIGVPNFSYEPITFTDVVVYKESDVTKYIANSDGSVNVKSISPYMYITAETDGINITATYHKSFGMQTEYDRFWDAYQQDGAVLSSANYMFSNPLWVDEIYQPKYPITPQRATAMYRYTGITDVIVDLDFTQSVTPGSTSSVFANTSALKRIPKIKVLQNMKYDSWFTSCISLEEVRFEGVIGNSLDIHWSTKLSAKSYDNIFSCLSTTATGVTLTVPTTAPAVYDAERGGGSWAITLQMWCPSNWTIAYA